LSGYHDWGAAMGPNGSPAVKWEIRVDKAQIEADMIADKPTAAASDRKGETVDCVIAHELGHGVSIPHHNPVGGGADNCIMRYFFNEINTHKKSANNDAPAWMAMTIPNSFCGNTDPDNCRDTVDVSDAP